MVRQPVIYNKNNPSVTLFRVNYGFTNMLRSFGGELKIKLEAAGMRASELSRRSGVTKQNIGRLLNNTPHTVSGALPRTSEDTVVKLARALDWDINEALLAAGHAPLTNENEAGLFSGLEKLSPAKQKLAKRQIKAIIDSLAEDEDTDGI